MLRQEKVVESFQSEFISDAENLVEMAGRSGVNLRAVGGLGIMMHCHENIELLKSMNRRPSDLDFVASSRQDREIDKLFLNAGYTEKGGSGVTMEVWTDRRIYEHPSLPHVDVFFDGLDFCHKIDYHKRLFIDNPTLSPADLMLGKLQIVEINEKDLQDILVLNLEHRLSDQDSDETINAKYLSRLMSQDWGFYYTSVLNLKKVKKLIGKYRGGILSVKDANLADTQISELIEWFNSSPKSLKWKMRAKIGTKVKWYKNPGEEYREIGE